MFCPSCGAQCEEADRFCGACGITLSSRGVPQVPKRKPGHVAIWTLGTAGLLLLAACIWSLASVASHTKAPVAQPNVQAGVAGPLAAAPARVGRGPGSASPANGGGGQTNFDVDPLLGEPVDKDAPCAEAAGHIEVPGQIHLEQYGDEVTDLVDLEDVGMVHLFSDDGTDVYALVVRGTDGQGYFGSFLTGFEVLEVYQDDEVREERLAAFIDMSPNAVNPIPGQPDPVLWLGSSPDSGTYLSTGSPNDVPDWNAVADLKYAVFVLAPDPDTGEPSVVRGALYAPFDCYSHRSSTDTVPSSQIGEVVAGQEWIPAEALDPLLYEAFTDILKLGHFQK